ncbi:MAG TPA: SpoIIE family protein phosphatase [Bryobacteraceae bacterium]|nr:SpoIIE family protein phosphatase [Bryobacteraceae bacterium]
MLRQDATAPRTLIADDQPDVLEALRLLLKREGYLIETVNSPKAVLDSLGSREYDLLLMDLNYALDTTSGQEGLDLLARVQKLDKTLPVVVMTAWGSIRLAVEAMQRGAADFVEKPWDNLKLLSTLRTQIESRSLRRHGAASESGEIEEASATQRGLLPREIPHFPGYGISAAWRPAGAVSGDYLDLLRLDADHLALCVADVIGKGVPAALLMSNVQAAVHALAGEMHPTGELCERINRIVTGNLGTGKFITFFYGVLDGPRRRFSYTNAGHCEPILVRQSGACTRVNHGGVVLGIFPDWSYQEEHVDLEPGDRLVLFTDGITEISNANDEEFGEERLMELLRANRALDAEGMQKRVMAAIVEFSGGKFQDDASLIVAAVD